jgi:hypothetical protein
MEIVVLKINLYSKVQNLNIEIYATKSNCKINEIGTNLIGNDFFEASILK